MDKNTNAMHSFAMGHGFFRRMDWLGAARATAYLRLFAVLNVVMLAVLVIGAKDGVDRNGFLLGSDFISFWTTGRMLFAGIDPYDAATHIAVQRDYFASPSGYTAFFYPPSFLPFCWPLGLLSYFAALAAWVVVTGLIYVFSVRAWWRRSGIPVPLWLLVAAFPAVPIVITHGQTAFLVAGLLVAGAALVHDRPVVAGVLFGLATVKPQFGLLLPLVLLVTREWRVIGAALATAAALASAVAFGASTWSAWLAASSRAQEAMAAGAMGYAKMTTPFAALKLLGAPTLLAYAGQGLVTLTVAALLVRVAWGKRWSTGLAAATLAAAPLATPFALDYDLVILAAPMLWLLGQGSRYGFADWEKLALALAFAAPAFARPLAMNIGVPITPPILGLLFWVILRRVAQQDPRSQISIG